MRLTKKGDNLYYTNAKFSSGAVFLDNNGSYTNACIDKLGLLEDIEEELGIDLVTLIKAFTQGFYVKSNDFMKAHYHFSPCLFKTDSDYARANEYIIEYGKDFIFLKDYGKTWALTREELL